MRRWDKDKIVAAVLLFHERYGRVPNHSDFSPTKARQQGHDERADVFYRDGCYPDVVTVQKYFGSFSAGLEAAGLVPTGPGGYERVASYKRTGRRGAHIAEQP